MSIGCSEMVPFYNIIESDYGSAITSPSRVREDQRLKRFVVDLCFRQDVSAN